MTNDKQPEFRVELKIFTRFVFKLVFKEGCHEIYLSYFHTYRRTQFTCNFQVLSVKAY